MSKELNKIDKRLKRIESSFEGFGYTQLIQTIILILILLMVVFKL